MSRKNEKLEQHEDGINVPSYLDLPEEEELQEFIELRERVLREQKDELRQRVATNPVPDDEELSAGAYREEIEPQCRKAIFTIRKKGYDTFSSGFGTGNNQVLDGIFKLDQNTIRLLKNNGYLVYRVGGLSVSFRPQNADIVEITQKWNRLAELLPELGYSARPHNKSLQEFNRKFEERNPF